MLKDKLKATDWETTDETMIEIVARESYLQWLKESQRKENHRKLQSQVRAESRFCQDVSAGLPLHQGKSGKFIYYHGKPGEKERFFKMSEKC